METMQAPNTTAMMIQALKSAIESTFSAICGQAPRLTQAAEATQPSDCYAGIISFVGDTSFSVSLILPRNTAVRLIKQFTSMDLDYESNDMADGVGELANVLAGDVTAAFERKRMRAQMSLPMVARGNSLKLISPGSTITESLDYQLPAGVFTVLLTSKMELRLPGT